MRRAWKLAAVVAFVVFVEVFVVVNAWMLDVAIEHEGRVGLVWFGVAGLLLGGFMVLVSEVEA